MSDQNLIQISVLKEDLLPKEAKPNPQSPKKVYYSYKLINNNILYKNKFIYQNIINISKKNLIKFKIQKMIKGFRMLDKAYFTSKKVILQWVKDILKLNVDRIEQAGTGAIYCQILDLMYPGKIKLNKVNWGALSEDEFISNLRIFQNGLETCGISKKIEIQRLAKARYQDNLELLQWLKGFYDNNIDKFPKNYDAEARRNYAQLAYKSMDRTIYHVAQGTKRNGVKNPKQTQKTKSREHYNAKTINEKENIGQGMNVSFGEAKMPQNINQTNILQNSDENIKEDIIMENKETEDLSKNQYLNEFERILLNSEPVVTKIEMAVSGCKIEYAEKISKLSGENFEIEIKLNESKVSLADIATHKKFIEKKWKKTLKRKM